MTRDEARALALSAYLDAFPRGPLDAPKWEPHEWMLVAIRRAAASTPAETRRPEPFATVGGLTITLQNSGGVLFKVVGSALPAEGVNSTSTPSVVRNVLTRVASYVAPAPEVSAVGQNPRPEAPRPPPWSAAPSLGLVSCCGNLKIEAQGRPVSAAESGFDIVVNEARTNRMPERVGFRWSSDPKDAAKDLRRLADCLHKEPERASTVVKCAPVAAEPPAIPFQTTGELTEGMPTPPPGVSFSESKTDKAFAAAEWQFIASSLGLARAALKQAGYPDQQFEGAQVLASTKVDEIRRMGGKS